ncbi:expressed unknown protein [Seminavis robusta]|uniref:Uncharacterized protein n=1 Tax=Seminavis robusta TaxID=568900 RepID=A0A9N8H2B0_9STRA|nr:expressed unknown protein [Seminavis robusta]|eukprot:Sro60_g034860.1 n/a (132) ;mRNA; r:129301-129696
MSEMRKLTKYFCCLGGESGGRYDSHADEVFDDLFHKDVLIVGNAKTHNFDEWKDWYKRSIQDGLVFEMQKVVKTGPDSIVWTLLIHLENGTTLTHTAKGLFKDGKLIKTEPADPTVYDVMTKPKRKPVCIL